MWKWIGLGLILFLCGCEKTPTIIMTSEQRFQMDVQHEIYKAKVQREALKEILKEEVK